MHLRSDLNPVKPLTAAEDRRFQRAAAGGRRAEPQQAEIRPSRSSTASRSRRCRATCTSWPGPRWKVFLEAFEGLLDPPLHPIRRQNLLHPRIPLAEITRQYMQGIELMQDLQLELAGKYLVMAATLAEIKSRMSLLRPQLTEDWVSSICARNWYGACRSTSASSAPPGHLTSSERLKRDVWPASAPLEGGAGGARCRS